MNSTTEKFGYPQTLVREFEHWLVLLRPAQVTLGSLVLASKSEAVAFSQISAAAFGEQFHVVRAIEAGLSAFGQYERINYLMLMMIDPHVHFHVIPRYSESRSWHGLDLPDRGWPGVPDLKSALNLNSGQINDLKNEIKHHF